MPFYILTSNPQIIRGNLGNWRITRFGHAINVKKYAAWLGYSPDLIIRDLKPVGSIPDPIRVQNHCDFLNNYLAELQDSGLKPTAINNCIKAVKTFYNVNGAEVKLKEKLRRKVAYKDRAPKPEELAIMLDKAAVRDAFIVAAIATGGFREATLASLKYRHVKEDLEANRFPIHVHVEASIVKGKYHDYDTFLNVEASRLLKIYIDARKKGTAKTPPEQLTDDAPLIRNSTNGKKVLGVSGKTIRKTVHTLAVQTGVSKKLAEGWMYDIRTHSLRKFFRTQMSAAKIDSEIIEYFIGHTPDTYEDVQSLGIETLRNNYTSAGLAIRPKTAVNRIDQLKEIIRAWGENPEEILTKDALIRGNITMTDEQAQAHQMSLLAEELKEAVKREILK
jgi:site-specific recombinase XerD